jgi:hypothetical protein
MARAVVDLRVALAGCFPLRFEDDFASEAVFRALGARVGAAPVMRSIWLELSPGGGSKVGVVSASAFSFPFDNFGIRVTSWNAILCSVFATCVTDLLFQSWLSFRRYL